MTAGVASRPASWRATVVVGRAKNSRNVTVATSHSTTMPARTRRMRKRAMFMAWYLLPLRPGRPGTIGLRLARARPGHLAGAAHTALAVPARRQQAFGGGVHRVPDPVAEQVERERGDQEHEGREHRVPPGHLVEVLRRSQDVAPAGRGRLDAQAEVGQGR